MFHKAGALRSHVPLAHASAVKSPVFTATAIRSPVSWLVGLACSNRDIGNTPLAGFTLLVFPDLAACRALAGDGAVEAVLCDPQVIAALRRGLDAYNADNTASSRRITRVLLMAEPPSIEAGEITDKGYVNQRAVIARRAELVERLYAADDPDVIRL